MSTRPPRSRRSGRRQLRAVRSPAADLARLRGAFLAWVEAEQLPVEPEPLWDDVVTTVDLATARAGLADLGSWTLEQIAVLADVTDEDESAALTALPVLIAFLGDTGRWRGSPEDLPAVLRAADELASPWAALLNELAGVQVDPAAEDAALRGVPVIAQAEELLRFVGDRRPVTGTQGLRRADVLGAAGRLGIDLAGRTPRSLWDVPRLADLWETLGDTGLLEFSPSVVTPSPLARAWLSGADGPSRQARELVAGGYLLTVLGAPSETPLLPHPLEALLPVLATAALGRPVPATLVLGPQADPDVRRLVTGIGELQVRGRLDRLHDAGLLAVDGMIAAPPGLSGLLARVTAALLRAQQLDDGAGDVELPPPDPELAGRAWRLRIELADARPPVWREVLVDPALPLDELHEVVQAAFGWEEAHLHEFEATGPRRRTTRFAPPDPDGDWFPGMEPAVDEAGVRLSQVIGPRRGQLRYRYDFGDCWDHRITVVGEEAAAGTALPRCTGGAGAAPAEDSGGVWGWADMVEAARDPRHPQHADIREWLGLEDGETLDPDAFDAAAVEERLRELRD